MTKKEKIMENLTKKTLNNLTTVIHYWYGDKEPEEWDDEDVRCEAHRALFVLTRLLK